MSRSADVDRASEAPGVPAIRADDDRAGEAGRIGTSAPPALAVLYLAVSLVSGLAMMMIEIAGVRLLAPVFGDSQYTWSASIGVILLAAGLGNALGGWLADRPDAETALTLSIAVAALSTLVLPAVGALLRDSLGSMGMVGGPLAFSAVLFVVPGLGFGTMATIAFRLFCALGKDRRVGLSQGLIGLAGLVGSVAGTLLTGFVLMRHFGVSEIIFAAAALLGVLGAASFTLHRQRFDASGTFLWAAITLFLGVFAWSVRTVPSASVIFETLSPYQLLIVTEEVLPGGVHRRRMIHDRTSQGTLDVETGRVPAPFQRMARVIELHRDELERALFVGGGTFGVPQLLDRRYPGLSSTVLEIDPAVVGAARDWFDLEAFDRIEPIVGDGRRYVRTTAERFDLIYLDAYSGWLSIPAHLTTAEFFGEVHAALAPDGIVMMNLIGRVDPPATDLFDAVVRTVNSVFERVDVYRIDPANADPNGLANLLLVAGDDLRPAHELEPVDEETRALSNRHVDPSVYADRDALLLTDDFAPIERLVSQTLVR